VQLDLSSVHTNIVYFAVPGRESEFPAWLKQLAERKVLAMYLGDRWRLVTHHDVDGEDVDRALAAWGEILSPR
jgi:threonine aldolase